MTLTLKESCRLYEQYCRRRTSTPSFEEFNQKRGTTLPCSDAVFTNFKKSIDYARNNEGLPIRSRLRSLYDQLSQLSPTPAASTTPSVQIRPAPTNTSSVPSVANSLKMNIRAPKRNPKRIDSSEATTNWTTDSYKELLSSASCRKLAEPNGLMVHFVSPSPISTEQELRASSCKLTKKAWHTLLGKNEAALTMRDGSSLQLSSLVLDSSDLSGFVKCRYEKQKGPYFIRARPV